MENNENLSQKLGYGDQTLPKRSEDATAKSSSKEQPASNGKEIPLTNMTPSQSQDRLQAWQNFVLALVVIVAIAILVALILLKVGLADQLATSVAIAGLGLIGTVIGSVVGHAQGAAGKQQEADRADARIKAVQQQADAHIQTLHEQVNNAQSQAKDANDTLKKYLRPPNERGTHRWNLVFNHTFT